MRRLLERIFSIKYDEESLHQIITLFGIKIKFGRKTPVIKLPKKYKFIHVMNNGIHSVNIINFLNKYFDNDEHCFVFPFLMKKNIKEELSGAKNVYHISLKSININHIKKIVVHGMFDENLVKFLYRNKDYLEKTFWFIWGGDLYRPFNTKIEQYVKENVAGIITSFDEETYKTRYGIDKKCYDCTYPHDLVEEMISISEKEERDWVHILVNNCADLSTIEMFEILAKFKDENIKISTILSYKSAWQKVSLLKIIKKGYETFLEKFNPITDFMPKDEYAQFLSTVDIYISNQDRQQGNGNAAFLCSLGKKVFVKTTNPVYAKYNSLGITYFNTDTIKDLSFSEFIEYNEETKEQTVRLLKKRMNDKTKIKQWETFFNDI